MSRLAVSRQRHQSDSLFGNFHPRYITSSCSDHKAKQDKEKSTHQGVTLDVSDQYVFQLMVTIEFIHFPFGKTPPGGQLWNWEKLESFPEAFKDVWRS